MKAAWLFQVCLAIGYIFRELDSKVLIACSHSSCRSMLFPLTHVVLSAYELVGGEGGQKTTAAETVFVIAEDREIDMVDKRYQQQQQ